jgi:hypothetical protein
MCLNFTTPFLNAFYYVSLFYRSLLHPSSFSCTCLLHSSILRYTFAMIPNQNLRIHNIHRLGSPPPPFKCPHCPRHFRSKGGRTKHIQAKHYANESEPLGSSPSSSPSPSSSQNSSRKSHEPSPSIIGSEPHRHSDVAVDDIGDHADFDFAPPGPCEDLGEDLNRNSPPGVNARDEHPPCVTRAYHPKLDGKPVF